MEEMDQAQGRRGTGWWGSKILATGKNTELREGEEKQAVTCLMRVAGAHILGSVFPARYNTPACPGPHPLNGLLASRLGNGCLVGTAG